MSHQNLTDGEIKRIANKAGINYIPYPELGHSEIIEMNSIQLGDLIRDCIRECNEQHSFVISY